MPPTATKRAKRALGNVDLAELDREIHADEEALAKKKQLRHVVETLQHALGAADGNGAGPHVTKRQQIVDFQKGRRSPVSPVEIAQALGIERAQVQPALYALLTNKAVKRSKDGGWEAA